MGGDEAVILSDLDFAGSDSLATSRVLAAGIAKVAPFDLVLAGNESADGGTVHVPSQVGELLGVAHLSTSSGWRWTRTGACVRARGSRTGTWRWRGRSRWCWASAGRSTRRATRR